MPTETKTVIDDKVIDIETEAWKALPMAEKSFTRVSLPEPEMLMTTKKKKAV